MTIADPKRLFDAIRRIAGRALTQSEVDSVNAAIAGTSTGLKPDNRGLSLIKQFEDCRLTSYPDPGTGGDPWTIGWGSTGPGIKPGVRWTQAQADARFAEDVQRFADGLRGELNGYPTTAAQFNAMLSMAYNVGLRAMSGSTLMRKHKAGDYRGAAAEFGKWVNAGGKRLNGLVRRRAAEAALYQSE